MRVRPSTDNVQNAAREEKIDTLNIEFGMQYFDLGQVIFILCFDFYRAHPKKFTML
jgi:hypothetical protein